jgi:hypothetical protein
LLAPNPNTDEPRTAFLKNYGLGGRYSKESYGVARAEGEMKGCRVPVASINLHCHGPHIECASHISEAPKAWFVSDALDNGTFERALLVTPLIERLGESGDSYPIGDKEDFVISSRQITQCLSAIQYVSVDTIVIRVPSDHLPCHKDSFDIAEWPYLTLEATELIRMRFKHYRTNAPSIERRISNGSMWSHSLFFGVEEATREIKNLERKTVGELFCIPESVPDGKYILQCPFIELELDAAPTTPILYEWLD